jgi:hypothetical protein
MSGPQPPYLRRAEKDALDKGSAGKKHESSLAARLGGQLTPGSGALAGAKGDVKLTDFLVEAKTTVRESISVQQSWLRKIRQESLECGKTPALSVAFVNSEGKSDKRDRWVMVPEDFFKEHFGS